MNPDTPGIVVFPGAGSFGSELQPLVRELAPSAWLARYPGRFGRDVGSGTGSFAGTVESCVDQVRRLRPSRFVLVGHSFGAYVAYATATQLEQLGTEVSALVVVGATAPTLLTVPESATRNRSGAEDYLERIEPGLISRQSDEWRDIVLDSVMRDLRLLKEFTESAFPQVRCPIFAARGEEDPVTSSDGIGEWDGATSDGCTRKSFAGGHSDVLHSPELVSWLRALRGRPSLPASSSEGGRSS